MAGHGGSTYYSSLGPIVMSLSVCSTVSSVALWVELTVSPCSDRPSSSLSSRKSAEVADRVPRFAQRFSSQSPSCSPSLSLAPKDKAMRLYRRYEEGGLSERSSASKEVVKGGCTK